MKGNLILPQIIVGRLMTHEAAEKISSGKWKQWNLEEGHVVPVFDLLFTFSSTTGMNEQFSNRESERGLVVFVTAYLQKKLKSTFLEFYSWHLCWLHVRPPPLRICDVFGKFVVSIKSWAGRVNRMSLSWSTSFPPTSKSQDWLSQEEWKIRFSQPVFLTRRNLWWQAQN